MYKEILRVENLSKSFKNLHDKKKSTPLDDVSFEIYESEIVGFVGKSGEGKSTIAKILCGVLKKDCGNIFLDNANIFDKNGKYLRKQGLAIQLVSQSPLLSLDPTQCIGDGIVEIIKKHNKKLSKSECEQKAVELIEKVNLDSAMVKRLPNEISSGQSQRIGIARCLAVRPRLLIADESTSMLDVKSQAQVIEIYRQLKTSENMSVLFISHDIELVNVVSDRCYELKNGKLELIK